MIASGAALKYNSVAVLIPCYNEAASVVQVIADFKRVLPGAKLYVYDNNSVDNTAELAAMAGAIVRPEPLQGKGHVVRRMFADIEADVYLIVDGDGTYDASAAPIMINTLVSKNLDMVNARRIPVAEGTYRPGHKFGNWFLTSVVSTLFGNRITDMLSGYKALSRRFVKSFPCLSTGFEIETEIAVHALELQMPIDEHATSYSERSPESNSKLHTIKDGMRIGWTIINLLRAERPMMFFGFFFFILALLSSLLGLEIFIEWERTGLVLRMPTAVLCTGMMLLAFLSAVCGMILETVTRGRRENKRMVYLGIAATRTSSYDVAVLRDFPEFTNIQALD